MDNDQLQKWALIAEIIGGIAVVFSLIFVGLQIQQDSKETALNTRAIEVSAYQDLVGQIMAINFNSQNNSELRGITQKLTAGGDLGPEDDRGLYGSFVLNLMRHADMAYFQYQNGIIDEERLNSALGIFINQLSCSKVALQIWNGTSAPVEEFRSYITRRLEDATC